MAFEESKIPVRDRLVNVDVEGEVRELLAELERIATGHRVLPGAADVRLIARGLQLTLTVLATSLGECRVDIPFSPLRPVRRSDGTLVWCCNHKPEHCD